MSQAGKGDKPRPVVIKKWDDNYENINWKNKKKKKKKSDSEVS